MTVSCARRSRPARGRWKRWGNAAAPGRGAGDAAPPCRRSWLNTDWPNRPRARAAPRTRQYDGSGRRHLPPATTVASETSERRIRMKGDDDVIELLNDVLTGELTAINQYFIDTKMCANWGYDRLAVKVREESMEEMRDAEALIDRILYLDGIPNLQRLGSVRIGESVPEQLTLALEQETLAIQ